MKGVVEDFPGGSKQAEIDAPRVHADPVQLDALAVIAVPFHASLSQTDLQFLPLSQQVPVQVTIDSAGGIDEAVLLLKRQLVVVECADDRTSALRTQIERK